MDPGSENKVKKKNETSRKSNTGYLIILRKYLRYFRCDNSIVVMLLKRSFLKKSYCNTLIDFRCLIFASKEYKRSYVDSDIEATRLIMN